MRSDPSHYQLQTVPTLNAALRLLAEVPGQITPLAGGTELMVAFNAGRLPARSLVSIGHLAELRFIRADGDHVEIGAGSTFTDIRKSSLLSGQFASLQQAASWTGSIANQNRATLGGNLCNASPAADSPPALLAYDALVKLVSTAGERVLPYSEFHLGYRKTALRPAELLYSVLLPPLVGEGWKQSIRKVGARNAQAISKSAVAMVARVVENQIVDIRLGAASVADRPLRLKETEAAVRGASLQPSELETTVRLAGAAVAGETRPIDDIRSTARYRTAVTANLVEDFLRSLSC